MGISKKYKRDEKELIQSMISKGKNVFVISITLGPKVPFITGNSILSRPGILNIALLDFFMSVMRGLYLILVITKGFF